jgi:hypothetical protein
MEPLHGDLPLRRVVLSILLWGQVANAGELCFATDPWVWSCGRRDVVFPMHWIGFSTDSTRCEDSIQEAVYWLSLSASSTDPGVHAAPVPRDGRIYVWMLAEARSGYGFPTISAEITGSLRVLSYEPIADGTHFWTTSGPNRFFFGYDSCPEQRHPPLLLGAVVVLRSTTSAQPESWGRVKALYR